VSRTINGPKIEKFNAHCEIWGRFSNDLGMFSYYGVGKLVFTDGTMVAI
jgi:hypothetical protein